MKIALFVSGHLRESPQNYENYKQFLEDSDTKVFVSTWSAKDINRTTFEIETSDVDISKTVESIFGHHLEGLWVGNLHKYEKNESPHPDSPPRQYFYDYCPVEKLSPYGQSMYPWQQRVMDQWYTIYQAYQLCKNYDEFDVCVRIRLDADFTAKPETPFRTNTQDGIHVNGYWWSDFDQYDDTGLRPFRISEQLGWGTPKWMRKYFEYYTHYIELFVPLLQLPDNKFHFGSEHMFAYYILRYPYFNKNLTPDINDHDVVVHRHGRLHRVHDGIIDNDYYNLTVR